jgi:addiction module HigA family antidote
MTTKKIFITSGYYLNEQYLKPLKISAYRLAKEIKVSSMLISQILRGKTAISPDIAYKLGVFFETGTQYWLDLQALCDTHKINEKYENKSIKINSYKEIEKNNKKKLT